MELRSDLEILLGLGPGEEFPQWDLLKQLDRVEKRKGSTSRKEANRRYHRNSPIHKKYNNAYHKRVMSPRRKLVREWMRTHPEEVGEIRKRNEV